MTNNLAAYRRGVQWLGRRALLAMLLIAMMVPGAKATYAASLTVISTNDGTPANDEVCTLREAIINANANNQSGSTDCAAGGGADTIDFNIPGTGLHTIVLASALPIISESLTIDARSQSGTNCGVWP